MGKGPLTILKKHSNGKGLLSFFERDACLSPFFLQDIFYVLKFSIKLKSVLSLFLIPT